MILNRELAEICGIHAGDGYLRNDGKRKELDISGNYEEKEYYDFHVIPLFNKFFKVQTKGKYFPHRNTYGFVIRNPNIIKFMHKLGFPYGNKSLNLKLPSFILENQSFKLRFLRGYFDTDGHLGFAKKYGQSYAKFKRTRHCYPRLMFSTVSKPLANNLKKIFNELNFNYVHFHYMPKKSTENLRYRFDINGVSNLKKWIHSIGIKNPTKYSRFLIWKKHGFCPTNITYPQRLNILKGLLDPNTLYKGL